MNSRITVIGLGKLGTPLAICLAARGCQTIGVDLDLQKLDALNQGFPAGVEPGLDVRLAQAGSRLRATSDLAAAIAESDLSLIVLPTPSGPAGDYALTGVLGVCGQIGAALRDKTAYHLVVLISTVMPGSTDGPVKEMLESSSGKRCGLDFGLCYNPAFIALGNFVHDFLNPDFVLIGESDARAGQQLEALYQRICESRPAVARMNFTNAELAKLAVNSFLTLRISFANLLARLCERLPGADVDQVTGAMGLDSRIGPKYLRGAIGYGGPCFPRDNRALSFLAAQLGVPALLAESADRSNRAEIAYLLQLIEARRLPHEQVGILGLAYKPNTDVSEESQGLLLAQALAAQGVDVIAYDPAAMVTARQALPGSVRLAASARACLEQAGLLVVLTPWPEFRRLDFSGLGCRLLIDCWRWLDPGQLAGQMEYLPLGVAYEPVD
ncbi:MAG: UDP-glucose/GDP-mannose dehydrogenase family protein [Candidatus Sericytochromatia bacterium]